MTTSSEEALGWFHAVHDLSPSGVEMTIEASTAERKTLAEQLDIVSVESCIVSWTIKPWRKSGVRVMGTLKASVTQTCGVTLEPVPGEVSEEIDVRLTTEERLVSGSTQGNQPQSETLDFDPEDRDPPELFDGSRIPLGDIAYEHLALGLDPYPRAPDVAFEGFDSAGKERASEAEVAENTGSGFSALAQWGSGTPTGGEN